MNLTLGFSPCPNDTFMFAALVNGWIDTGDLTFKVHMDDVEQLNEWAGSSYLDITKMSFHRALDLEKEYALLSSGAALGFGCGPLLIARESLSPQQIVNGPIALPGKWTTAHLLFKFLYPHAQRKEFMRFNKIEEAILQHSVAGGVIIHENRFTYQGKGLVKITDLGKDWEEKTGLPIPLGGIFSRQSVDPHIQKKVDSLIRESILFARRYPEKVMPYVRQYAQEMDEHVMSDHIHLYVNDYSIDMGDLGLQAIRQLKKVSS